MRSLAPAVIAMIAVHGRDAKAPEAAQALLSYLSSPEVADVYQSLGMEPGR